jgi:hypothetical protein
MNVAPAPLSTLSGPEIQPAEPGILAQRWPLLGRALSQYQQGLAEHFSRMAYDRVEAGLIRLEQRQQLAAEADDLGIRPFDAQLLIACAIRQWVLDRDYDPRPSLAAPALSFEYKSWRRVWLRIGIVIGFAVAFDAIVIWKWLH